MVTKLEMILGSLFILAAVCGLLMITYGLTQMWLERPASTQDFQEVLGSLPAYLRSNRTIVFTAKNDFSAALCAALPACDENVVGTYDPFSKSVHVKSGRSIQATNNTLYHEIGHAVWYEVMTKEEQKAWISIPDSPITEYAETNEQEDFAENFAIYFSTSDWQALHPINPEKKKMIDEVLSRAQDNCP